MPTDYISHYLDLSVAKNLDVLQNWPSDDKIRVAIQYAYKQATTLAKDVLEMIINTQIRGFTTISENKEEDLEVKNEIKSTNLQSVNSLQETESIFISAAAAEIKEDNSFSDGCSQLAMILGSTQSQNINIEITIDIGVVNGVLKLSKLVNQRHHHEAYTSQRMEKRVVESSTFIPQVMDIQPYIISLFK
ncbi:hypothetical protein F8M41_009475 [Gigaspora margarita]|uniref:Uncharacterized protein n=1 Tax=Gigaspora margarita TaxID=4874 RepID=A0A8H3X591_GIGMA|nr:hypothetical protein F8M41_009475 [Gigaspora margarita]